MNLILNGIHEYCFFLKGQLSFQFDINNKKLLRRKLLEQIFPVSW